MSAVNISKLVEDNFVLDSRRCCKISNTQTGNEFFRSPLEIDRWEHLYKYAKKHPDEFVCEYDASIAPASDDPEHLPVFEESHLRTMSMPELRKIGLPLKVTGVSKDEIIKRILGAQED